MLLLGDDPVVGSRVPSGARRALALFASVAAGIALVHALEERGCVVPASAWAGAAGIAVAAGLVLGERRFGLALLASCGMLAAAWTTWRWHEPPGHRLDSLLAAQAEVPIEVIGIVTSAPERSRPPEGAMAGAVRWSSPAWSFAVDMKSVLASDDQWRRAGGTLRVFAGQPPAVVIGQSVRVSGLYSPVRASLNPGAWDARRHAAETGSVGGLRLGQMQTDPPELSLTGLDRAAGAVRRVVSGVRARCRDALLGEEASDERAVVAALVLGEREHGSSSLRAAFARQGVAHLLAISGFHLVLVCAAALFVIRLITGGRLGAAESIAVALVVAAYMVLVPARPPIVRSGLMVLGLIGAEAAGRRYHGLGVLAWIGVAMLAWRPSWLFDTGFQFSFLMTGALVWLGARVDARLARRRLDAVNVPPDLFDRRWWGDLVRKPISAGLVCWAAGAAIVGARFGWVSPLAVLSTVVIVPMVAAVLVLGVAAALLAAMGLPVQASGLLEALAMPAATYVEAMDSWAWTRWRVGAVPEWLGWAGCALALAWMGAAAAHRRLLIALTSGWTLAIIAGWAAPRVVGPPAVIDMFAVGDGSCLVISSRGESVLWDAGSTRPDLGVWELPRAMRSAGIGRVRTAIVTHANYDHFSALPDLVDPLGVERVLVSPAFMAHAHRPQVAQFLDEMARRGVRLETIERGESLAIGVARVEVLLSLAPSEAPAANDQSLVARLSTPGGRAALLTGDIQAGAMRAMVGVDVAADVLELPHHGSVHTPAVEFVSRVRSSVVLQSTGPSRVGDLRWASVADSVVWRTTAVDGWTRVELRDAGPVVRSARAPRVSVGR